MTKADEEMTEEQTFNEWVKQLEPSMAVPMYPKALLLDFMKKAFFAGLEQHSHDYLVKTKDLKANFDYVLEGKDLEIKLLGERCNQLLKDKGDLKDNYDQFKAIAEPEIERLKKENEELRNNGFTVSAMTEQQLKIAIEKGEQLEKENAELREKYLQATDEGTSFAHLKSLERENTKLKEQIEKMKCCGNCSNLCGCGIRGYEECKNYDKWELREIEKCQSQKQH
jgi:hypothetical protein